MSTLAAAHEHSDGRQARALAWAREVYGDRVLDRRYQSFRFLEEAMELVQTQGLDFLDVMRLADYVFRRPVGDTKTEIGDVRFTLDILAENLGVSVDSCHASTLNRVKGIPVEKAIAKDDAKIAAGLI